MNIKLRAGKYLIPAKLEFDGDYIYVSFGFNRTLINEIKMFEGARWLGYADPPRKVWRINASPHNYFQLKYLCGKNPYENYDKDVIEYKYTRPLYDHQKTATDFILAFKQVILAAEMGCGKTLCGIEVMERSGFDDWWYVGPRSAIKAVEYEFREWDSRIIPRVITYQGLVKIVKNWDDKPPKGIWFDESSRIKNPTAQRSQAALFLANEIRREYKENGFVILTSGAPAPKSPLDWWHQAKTACPGFLREGSYSKFRQTLAIISQEENPFGQAYPKIVSWLDDNKKCAVCGEPHNPLNLDYDHEFKQSVNECERLYKRMSGLVLVQFKRNCLDLPEKIYRQIKLQPSKETLDIAKSLVAGAKTVVSGLILLRELSDGFQYVEKVSGEKVCSICFGEKTIPNPMANADIPEDSKPDDININETVLCDGCGGTGKVKTYARETIQIDTPKDEALRDLLDEYNEIGRVVIYAGFTGSIDRCVEICKDLGWDYIRVDGRGWHSNLEGDPLTNFQKGDSPRLAFIGQPGAAGMGLTLTASPVIIYYSNDFNAESRIQSEDRIHRPGSRGCTIIDLLHLHTDYLIMENLKNKRKLQALTLGDITKALENHGTNSSRII